ncbi:hypothetical protein PUN28_004286 [Cardiocondyla obscurior]|uniref:Uncharacterized protein n=1 Tax=Cardiocondyla obscurior TaxID=286306 RepID=A0AAW2G9Y7_9HYME
MLNRVTTKTVVLFTKVVVALSFSWPLSKNATKFQVYLVSEMEYNFKYAKPYEEVFYQRYINRCAMFYASITAAVFLGAFISGITPLIVTDQIFPAEAKYPFDVEHEPIKTIIFLHQFVAVWQCFSIVCLCSFVALFIWFSAARFEILSQQLRAVTDFYGTIVCVQQHIKLLR